MEFRPENTKTIKLADILEGKITLIMIKPEVNDDVAGNLKRDGTTFGRDDLIEEIARRAGLEVIMKFGPIDFSEEDMDVFYDEAKKGWAKKFADKGPGFPDKILMRTKQQFGGGPVYIAILKGDNEPWQRVRDVLGKTDGSEAESIRYDYGTVVIHHDDGTMTMFNRAHGSDSLTSVLFEIYFFAAIKAIPIINQESIQPLESTLLETGRIPTSLVVTNKLLGPSLKGQASGMNFGKNRAVLTAIASAA
jgi:nucleoside diphosphate kinase